MRPNGKTIHGKKLQEAYAANVKSVVRLIESRVAAILKESIPGSYEMDDPDVSTMAPEANPDVPFDKLTPMQRKRSQRLPHTDAHSTDYPALNSNGSVSFMQGDHVTWQERSELEPEYLITYHGTVQDTRGIIVKVVVDSFEKGGRHKRLATPLVKFPMANKLKLAENPPDHSLARQVKAV